ncbi:hypothetical protein GGS23DRAFT_562695 [Durotheca rogersii]|uniref:uncharacterized protein n=1 Tax=Durotheca rogersii TaxID=419775 RepID=UPI00221E49A6|nr:uncharacterized protein GGS23DRAFT_562695 [Durotheca rogersii]KAI5864051.1 hypothetical protein GGS23DRAFT_562695 [Durotheca rogersii]
MGYDEILDRKNVDEKREFVQRFVSARDNIVQFVASRLGWSHDAKFAGIKKGSFNVSFVVRNVGDGSKVLIRFPFPGQVYTPWLEEKVTNEVMVLGYIHTHTTIPVPRVLAWGPADVSPSQLGPFIIMEFIEGTPLDTLMGDPTVPEKDPPVLDPAIDERKLTFVYDQIASLMLQLSRLPFSRIGAIGETAVSRRPLTYDMNELVTITGTPASAFPDGPFDKASDYFNAVAHYHRVRLSTQRNAVYDAKDARRHLAACQGLAKLIPQYCDQEEGYFLYIDDFHPTNILADPDTWQITAVVDLEFINAMPAQYAYDVPPWLLLREPPVGRSPEMNELETLFTRRMEQFLAAVQRAETASPDSQYPSLSAKMRESWDTKRFWFNLAMRNPLDASAIYEYNLRGPVVLDQNESPEIELFVAKKLKQLEEYKREEAQIS